MQLKSKYVRRHHMTLLETLIAITILSVLLVILFGFFKELSVLSQASEKKQKESFQMRYLETRLSYIFERLVNESSTARDFFFYLQPPNGDFSKDPSLVFSFDNGIREDPYYSGDILGRIYLDLNQQLHLTTWPMRAEKPFAHMQDEILLDGVEKIKFEFYSPPERIEIANEIGSMNKIQAPVDKTNATNTLKPNVQGKERIKTEPEKDKWQDIWLITHQQMPTLLKIDVTMKEENKDILQKQTKNKEITSDKDKTLHLIFVLPSSKNPVQVASDKT